MQDACETKLNNNLYNTIMSKYNLYSALKQEPRIFGSNFVEENKEDEIPTIFNYGIENDVKEDFMSQGIKIYF